MAGVRSGAGIGLTTGPRSAFERTYNIRLRERIQPGLCKRRHGYTECHGSSGYESKRALHRGANRTPAAEQVRAFWYQWFMATDRGAEVVRQRGTEFARFQWETWSPPGWFDEETFATTAASFQNPDWAEITLHAYRVRWGEASPDPAYSELETRQHAVRSIAVPTLMIQGGDDRCVLPESSEDKQQYFTGSYARHVLVGVGHFPTREAAPRVSKLVEEFLRTATRGR
jgi:pimeloyl-ACP methyl ester carboxylesterase